AGRDSQAINASKGVDEFLGQSIAEKVLIACRTHVSEWQDGNGGNLRCLRSRVGGFFIGRFRELSDELIPASMASLNKTRLLGIVRERSPQLLNTRRERVVSDRDSIPNKSE